MKTIILVVSIATLAGCGSFQLGNVHPQSGKTAEQQQLDMLGCKDRAHIEANTAGRQVGSFIAGMTIIGAPIAFEAEKSKQREVFAECMQARGYTVTPANDAAPLPSSATSAPKATGFENLKLDLPAGFNLMPMQNEWRAQGILLHALNPTADIGTFVSAAPRAFITDMAAYVLSRRASLESAMTDARSSEITQLAINGRPAWNFEVTGVLKQVKVTYHTSIIEGATQIAVVNSWTSASNFLPQKEIIAALPSHVSGLR